MTPDPDMDQEFVDLLSPSDPNLDQEFVTLVTPQHIIQDIEMTENEELDQEAVRLAEKGFLLNELDETKKQILEKIEVYNKILICNKLIDIIKKRKQLIKEDFEKSTEQKKRMNFI
ncbi:unnamed protein product [Ceutorhynchus assimilis]|uniref:Uncharacterized protein n=1 Tax=Ceutorhynchus assimilis TaxID=467358 RepID=A0A9N9N270_9CUCU|nr:unnamed protein product [Ceutorhynchus assimilis]